MSDQTSNGSSHFPSLLPPDSTHVGWCFHQDAWTPLRLLLHQKQPRPRRGAVFVEAEQKLLTVPSVRLHCFIVEFIFSYLVMPSLSSSPLLLWRIIATPPCDSCCRCCLLWWIRILLFFFFLLLLFFFFFLLLFIVICCIIDCCAICFLNANVARQAPAKTFSL